MLERRTLARPYAKAIFEIANQYKTYAKWSEILAYLVFIAENSTIQGLLKDKTIMWQEMANLFLSVCEKVIDELSRNLILVLALNKRLEILPEITSLYEEMRAEKENTIDVQLVSSRLLTEAEKIRFKQILEQYFARSAHIQYAIDDSLIGGFIAKAGNYVIDSSIQGQLTNLKEVLGDSL